MEPVKRNRSSVSQVFHDFVPIQNYVVKNLYCLNQIVIETGNDLKQNKINEKCRESQQKARAQRK